MERVANEVKRNNKLILLEIINIFRNILKQ